MSECRLSGQSHTFLQEIKCLIKIVAKGNNGDKPGWRGRSLWVNQPAQCSGLSRHQPISLHIPSLMSCTDWADKALLKEIGSIWVNKQPASFTKMPEIGFTWVTLQVILLHLPGFRTREILSCTCLFWFSYLHHIHMGSSVPPFGEQCCKGKLAIVLREKKMLEGRAHG